MLLGRQSVEITLSPENAGISAEAVPGRRVAFVPFGTRVGPRTIGTEPAATRPVVLAPGNDIHRDWTLLRDAAVRLPEIGFRVATRRAAALALDWPPNAEVGAATVAELTELYGRCSAVAVPLRRNSHASGVTVCLEALGAGLPLVVTNTGGIAAYFGDEVTLVSENDVEGFARGIAAALNGDRPAADILTRRGLTQQDYVWRFVHLTRAVLSGVWDDSVSATEPVSTP